MGKKKRLTLNQSRFTNKFGSKFEQFFKDKLPPEAIKLLEEKTKVLAENIATTLGITPEPVQEETLEEKQEIVEEKQEVVEEILEDEPKKKPTTRRKTTRKKTTTTRTRKPRAKKTKTEE